MVSEYRDICLFDLHTKVTIEWMLCGAELYVVGQALVI